MKSRCGREGKECTLDGDAEAPSHVFARWRSEFKARHALEDEGLRGAGRRAVAGTSVVSQ